MAFPLVGCKDKQLSNLTNYNISLSYDEDENILTGKETVTFFNYYDNMFENLYFHLYPNAFREDAKNKVVSSTKIEEAYPNGLSYGNIEIKSVLNNGNQLKYSVEGQDQNILNVSLPLQLYPDDIISIDIEFTVKLANINHRLGYGENTINFGNFYPILAVYESGKGFMLNPYHSNGDPFYSECSNYQVEIDFSKEFNIAHSGKLMSIIEEGNRQKVKIEEDNIRDFAFVLSNKFEKISTKINDIVINYWGYKDDDDLNVRLQTCVDAVETFNDMIGVYPYSQLNVVKSNFVHGGMEFPELVLISDKVLSDDNDYVIVHEIAHQWWYGIIGNDEYNHAWIDEGLTEYSTLLFFEENDDYGFKYNEMIKSITNSYKLFEKIYTKVTGEVDGRMERPLNEFNTEPEYVQCIYNKSVIMFDSLREMIGIKKLKNAMKDLYKDYSYKNVSPEILIASFIYLCPSFSFLKATNISPLTTFLESSLIFI